MSTRMTPIPLRLNPDIKFEAELRAEYEAKPRARRQEFLRQLLRLGWEVMKQMEKDGTTVAPLAALVPRPSAITTQQTPAQVTSAPVASQMPAGVPLGTEVRKESSKALKGFFGSDQQLS